MYKMCFFLISLSWWTDIKNHKKDYSRWPPTNTCTNIKIMVNDYSFWSWPHKQTALICTLMVWHKHGNLTKSYPRPQEGTINPFTCNGQIGWEYFNIYLYTLMVEQFNSGRKTNLDQYSFISDYFSFQWQILPLCASYNHCHWGYI